MRRAESNEEKQCERQQHPIEERDAKQREDARQRHEEVDVAAFVAVKPWLDEAPKLQQDPRRRQRDRRDDRELHVGRNGFGGGERLHLLGLAVCALCCEQRPNEDVADFGRVEKEQDRKRQGNDKRAEDAGAEFLQVIAETHRAEIGRLIE